MNPQHIVPLQRQYNADHRAALARIAAAGEQRLARKVEAEIAAERALAAAEAAAVLVLEETAAAARASKERQRERGFIPAWPIPQWLTIQVLVAVHYGKSRSGLIGPRRTAPFVLPRQVAMFLIREFAPSMSTTQIGRQFGGRDHATVIHSIQKIAARIAADPAFAAEVEEIRAAIEGRAS